MSHVLLIYNPMAGARQFPMHLDRFVRVFQGRGYDVRLHRTQGAEDFGAFFKSRDMRDCSAIIVAGGDGSVNQVVNAMMARGLTIPFGVIPSGTANDFAQHIGMPMDLFQAIDSISEMNVDQVDVGQVNDRYFVNVCCGGLFTNISQNMDLELKNTLGKLGYYIMGMQQLPRFTTLKLEIQYEEGIVVDDFYLFLLLNGSSAGGFNRLGYNANISDGKMDFVGIRACHVAEIPQLFGKILMGEHLDDRNVLFFQSGQLTIHCLEGPSDFMESDIDGEAGPQFPLKIRVLHNALNILKPLPSDDSR